MLLSLDLANLQVLCLLKDSILISEIWKTETLQKILKNAKLIVEVVFPEEISMCRCQKFPGAFPWPLNSPYTRATGTLSCSIMSVSWKNAFGFLSKLSLPAGNVSSYFFWEKE